VDGELTVTLPARAPLASGAQLVREREAWIAWHVGRIAERRRALAARPRLEEGRPIPIGGVPHVVELVGGSADRRRSRVDHDDVPEPTIRITLAPGDERPLAAILERWLRAEARAAIERRVLVRARDLDTAPSGLAIRDGRSRWGSASRRGNLSFSWRLLLAPAAVLDYVVVHELAHLRVFGHGPRFWALVRRHVPDADRHRHWLREHEAELRHALD
jgi:predicted metal-dependent hydrolase